ncbi:MAG: hypothetical protein WKF70_02710 [Chitinophagaceae bacterium]
MRSVLTLLFCCGATLAFTQNPLPVFQFQTAVSLSPTALIGLDRTLMVGGERRLPNRLALVLDAGLVFNSSYLNAAQESSIGFALRPGVKLYTKDSKRFYLLIQAFYKQVDYRIYDWLGKNCVDNIDTYEQLQNFTFRKKSLSITTLTGYFVRLSDKVLLEFYGGLGIKIKDQEPTEPGACYRQNNRAGFGNIYARHSVSPVLPIGLKLVVPVGNRK